MDEGGRHAQYWSTWARAIPSTWAEVCAKGELKRSGPLHGKKHGCCCCYTRRLRMILSSAWALVGDWVSSAILPPKDCLLLSNSMTGHAIHRCQAVSSSSSPHSLQDRSSSSPIMDLHDLSLGWWPDLNLTRFTLSSLLIRPSSSSLILSGSLSSTSRVLSAYLLPTSSLMTAFLVL